MRKIGVRLGERSYSIQIGASLNALASALKDIDSFKSRPPKKALLVTHSFLARRYGATVTKALRSAGMETFALTLPEGEKSKNLATLGKIYGEALRRKLDRSSVIVALGGGVIGDTAGFAAATYLRGARLIQIPTTLLAMVDSSIGGKTGVDLPAAKNSVGAFHQPSLVYIDPSVLKTLPAREFRNGMAEVIKYGVLADKALFALLEKQVSALARSPAILANVIARCAAIKAGVVSRDERETKGLREILNFGHTLGHAIETVTHYERYKHGEAVAIGMCAAGFISRILNLWSEDDKDRMEDLIAAAGLPIRLAVKLPEAKILEALARDKKVSAGELRYVLPVKIGKVIVKKIPYSLALQGLKYVQP